MNISFKKIENLKILENWKFSYFENLAEYSQIFCALVEKNNPYKLCKNIR